MESLLCTLSHDSSRYARYALISSPSPSSLSSPQATEIENNRGTGGKCMASWRRPQCGGF